MSATPSPADLLAARRVLGTTVTNGNALREWPVSTYIVSERIDTKNGGTYLFCPCPSWKFSGMKSCKHTDYVRSTEGIA